MRRSAAAIISFQCPPTPRECYDPDTLPKTMSTADGILAVCSDNDAPRSTMHRDALSAIEAPVRVRRSESRFVVPRPMCHAAIRSGNEITLPRFELNHCRVGGVHDTVGCFAGVENRSHNRPSNQVARHGRFLLCAARVGPGRLPALPLKMVRILGANVRLNFIAFTPSDFWIGHLSAITGTCREA